MDHQSQPVGQEISCVMKGVKENFLINPLELRELAINSLKKFNFSILKVQEHSFSPQGYTLLILLGESHLAVHTYPEYNSIYFNLYSCRGPKDAEPTFELIKEKLKPKNILFYKENKIPLVG